METGVWFSCELVWCLDFSTNGSGPFLLAWIKRRELEVHGTLGLFEEEREARVFVFLDSARHSWLLKLVGSSAPDEGEKMAALGRLGWVWGCLESRDYSPRPIVV